MQKKSHKTIQVYRHLMEQARSLILSTSSASGMPDASTVPFVRDEEGDFIILISQLAQHTQNLQDHPFASVMILEDEEGAENLFARKRIQLNCKASEVDGGLENPCFTSLKQRHGKIVDLLASLPDFRLIRLHPESGQFVMGFGQAYRLTGKGLDELELISPDRPDRST